MPSESVSRQVFTGYLIFSGYPFGCWRYPGKLNREDGKDVFPWSLHCFGTTEALDTKQIEKPDLRVR